MTEDATQPTETQRVDHGERWRIEEIEPESQVYAFVGKRGTASDAVAKAKKQFAADHGVPYRQLVGKKIGRNDSRSGGWIVMVVHNPVRASHKVTP